VAMGLVQCDGCDGCGCVADNAQRIPWKYYTGPLVDLSGVPVEPAADKIPCGKCHGTGRIPIHKRNDWRRKRKID
jgi:hypothetical protein